MSLVRWTKATPKPIPGASKHRKRIEKEQALAEAYAVVDARDGGVCWVTGHFTAPGHVNALTRREHHHLVKRSQSKALRADPDNIITVCALAHDFLTRGLMTCEGTSAKETLRFHWGEVEPKDRPFQIKSRRWSQQ